MTGERRGEDALDEALERLARRGPEYGGGLANHGPMAAEALVALGRPESVQPWTDGYLRRLDEPLAQGRAIPRNEWPNGLGDFDRFGDWLALFDRELAEGPWQEVLALWTPRLAPGLIGAAGHGLIRAAHAVRGLGHRETPARRSELAQGLAYWAARFQRLPESQAAAPGCLLPSEALGKVPINREPRRTNALISTELEELEGSDRFAAVADLVDTSAEPSLFLSDLARTLAEVFLRDGRPDTLIALVHGLTGPSAARLLAQYLTPRDRANALRYAWQAGAALYSRFGRPIRETELPEELPAEEELIDRAVATGDEHAVKFTEACLREDAIEPHPVFRHAAAKATEQLAG